MSREAGVSAIPTDTGIAPTSPQDLPERASTGYQAALGECHDQLAPRVFGIVKRRLRDHAQSQEVAQEIFLEI
jgi:RNA polymerase sigma-70 factor (ECF subfamily)